MELRDNEIVKIDIDRFKKFEKWRKEYLEFKTYSISYMARYQESDNYNISLAIECYLEDNQPLKFTIKEMKSWLDDYFAGIDLEESLSENKLYYYERLLLLLLAYEIIVPLRTQKEIDMEEVENSTKVE